MKLLSRAIVLSLVTVLSAGCAVTTTTNENGTEVEAGLSDAAKLRAANLNIQLGMSYLSQNYTDLAKRKLLKAIELMPDLPEAHAAMGYYYSQVKDIPAAHQEYQRALNLGANNPVVFNSYGLFLCSIGEYQTANSYFLRAINVPSYTEVGTSYLNAGLCAQQAGDNANAEAYFVKAVEQNPKLALAYLNLAKLNYDAKQYKLAEQYLDKYNQNAPATPESLHLAIALAEQAGDNNRAASLRLLLQARFPSQVNS